MELITHNIVQLFTLYMKSHSSTTDLTESATADHIRRHKSFGSYLTWQKNHYRISYSGTCGVINLDVLFQFTSLIRQLKFFIVPDKQICCYCVVIQRKWEGEMKSN